jgi:hypothetical protein
MPVKAKLANVLYNEVDVMLLLETYSIEYNDLDPYNIDIGYYNVHRSGENGICIPCVVVFILVVGLILVATVVLWKLKRG